MLISEYLSCNILICNFKIEKLTNDVQVLILCLSYFITTVPVVSNITHQLYRFLTIRTYSPCLFQSHYFIPSSNFKIKCQRFRLHSRTSNLKVKDQFITSMCGTNSWLHCPLVGLKCRDYVKILIPGGTLLPYGG